MFVGLLGTKESMELLIRSMNKSHISGLQLQTALHLFVAQEASKIFPFDVVLNSSLDIVTKSNLQIHIIAFNGKHVNHIRFTFYFFMYLSFNF